MRRHLRWLLALLLAGATAPALAAPPAHAATQAASAPTCPPDDPGPCLQAVGDFAGAAAAFARTAGQQPKDGAALAAATRAISLYHGLGDPGAALEVARRFLEKRPRDRMPLAGKSLATLTLSAAQRAFDEERWPVVDATTKAWLAVFRRIADPEVTRAAQILRGLALWHLSCPTRERLGLCLGDGPPQKRPPWQCGWMHWPGPTTIGVARRPDLVRDAAALLATGLRQRRAVGPGHPSTTPRPCRPLTRRTAYLDDQEEALAAQVRGLGAAPLLDPLEAAADLQCADAQFEQCIARAIPPRITEDILHPRNRRAALRRLRRWIRQPLECFAAVDNSYLRLVRIAPPEQALLALARIGRLSEAFAEYTNGLPGLPPPLPPGFNPDPYDFAQCELSHAPFEPRAVEAYRLCMSKATDLGRWGPTHDFCAERLGHLSPYERADEIHAQPRYRLRLPPATPQLRSLRLRLPLATPRPPRGSPPATRTSR